MERWNMEWNMKYQIWNMQSRTVNLNLNLDRTPEPPSFSPRQQSRDPAAGGLLHHSCLTSLPPLVRYP